MIMIETTSSNPNTTSRSELKQPIMDCIARGKSIRVGIEETQKLIF
jgi:hypothetical protein